MNETVARLVDAIKSGDALATETAFADAMAEKLAPKLEDMRINVAQSMFAPQEPVSEEKEDDKEEDRRADRSDAPSSRRTRRVKPISTSVKPFDTIDSALQGLKENKEARAARRIAGGDPAKVVNPKTFPKMKVVNDTWRDVMKEHHPKIPALRLRVS